MAKRVLFFLTVLNRNGAVLSTLTTIKHLDRAKYTPELFVFAPSEAWPELLEDTSVTYGRRSGESARSYTPKFLGRLWRAAHRADILVGGLEMTPTFLVVVLGKLTGKPSVGFVRNSLPELLKSMPGRYRTLTKRLYPGLKRVVAISSGIQESVETLVPELRGRVRTVYIPLELDKVRARAEEPLGSIPREPYLVAVGRLELQKGFDLLLRAYAELRERGVSEKLVIVGEGKDKAKLQALAETLGITEAVVFTGFQANP